MPSLTSDLIQSDVKGCSRASTVSVSALPTRVAGHGLCVCPTRDGWVRQRSARGQKNRSFTPAKQGGWPIDAAPDGRREEEGVRGVWDGVAEECVVVAGPATRGALGRMRIGSGEGSEEGGARSCRGRWSGVRGAELADNVAWLRSARA